MFVPPTTQWWQSQPSETPIERFGSARRNVDVQTVSHWLTGQNLKHQSLEAMGKQASGREYFRVIGSTHPMVVMYTPVEDKPAEIGGDVAGDDLPFRHVRRWMESRGLPVPKEYLWDAEKRFLVLEDLGPVTLETALSESDRSMESLYGEAVDLLARLHERCQDANADDLPGLAKRFDHDFLRWELDHFREWLIDERRDEPLPSDALRSLNPMLDRLADEVASIPEGFTHRDFQSRNLMLADRGLVMLDFQDALRGPCCYDLVALLRDSYVEIPEPLLSELIERYRQQRTGLPDAETFRRWFDTNALQRKLKDAGRFVYIDVVKGNPAFLPHIPLSLKYVDEAFDRLPDYRDLRCQIAPFVPELSQEF
ncbi:MAG TPA: aminoglycoside phosphotransferase [Myxococcales bacterium]|nr:aminoglycoside phosphotransferase [Myxococcales bacterium]